VPRKQKSSSQRHVKPKQQPAAQVATARPLASPVAAPTPTHPPVPAHHAPEPEASAGITFLKLFLKATGLAIFFAAIMLLITAGILVGYAYRKVQQFSQASGVPLQDLKATLEKGWQTSPIATNGRKNILLLGIDSLANRGNVPPLTDTMMLVSVDLNTGAVYSLSFPRDIWSADYKTKINSLYAYGTERYPTEPERFPKEVIESLTGVPIHHTIVVSLDMVSTVIDQVGGIDVDVKEGFTDTQFPRSDVDITTERDPAKLYETITFEPGIQHMDGQTVLKYVRSRHSEGDTGTDISRGQRQQQVLDALLKKMLAFQTITDPVIAGQLYQFYDQTFASVFPIPEAIATAKQLYPHRDSIKQIPHTLSIYPDDPQGVLVNPPITKYKSWVYEIRNPATFKTEVQTDLQLDPNSATGPAQLSPTPNPAGGTAPTRQ